MKPQLLLTVFFLMFGNLLLGQTFERDVFNLAKGDLAVTFIGHGTLMMEYDGKIIHIDPVGRYADYGKMPKADLILITHQHGDHFDQQAINALKKENTELVLTAICAKQYPAGKVMGNGDKLIVAGFEVQAVPAYNMASSFHPKGDGNGYIIDFGGFRVYVAGDTENTPEMKQLKAIDVAFLPMNLPYTMTPEMVADAAKAFSPKILYPYHFGNTDTNKLVALMKNEQGIEVRVRKLK